MYVFLIFLHAYMMWSRTAFRIYALLHSPF